MKHKNLHEVLTVIASLSLIISVSAQNLVSNSGFEDGNTGFTTDYSLWTSGSIGAGKYAVTTNPLNVASNWGSYGDHTSGSGKMLVFDGSSASDNVLWRQSVSVATNTTYI